MIHQSAILPPFLVSPCLVRSLGLISMEALATKLSVVFPFCRPQRQRCGSCFPNFIQFRSTLERTINEHHHVTPHIVEDLLRSVQYEFKDL